MTEDRTPYTVDPRRPYNVQRATEETAGETPVPAVQFSNMTIADFIQQLNFGWQITISCNSLHVVVRVSFDGIWQEIAFKRPAGRSAVNHIRSLMEVVLAEHTRLRSPPPQPFCGT